MTTNTQSDNLRNYSSNNSDPYNTDIFDFMNACSTNDCTGLIPAAPSNDAEYEAYNDIYFFQPPDITATSSSSNRFK